MSRNGYSYVHNNPVNYTDPSGMIIPWGAGAAIAFLVGCGYGGIREALNQINQDDCGGNFFDKLMRVDMGPVLLACLTGGMFTLGSFFLLGGAGSAFAYGAGLSLTGYLIGSGLRGNTPTIRGLGASMTFGGFLGYLNSWLAAGFAPNAPLIWRIVETGPVYIAFGIPFSWIQYLITDDDPSHTSKREGNAMLFSGVSNGLSVFFGPVGIGITLTSFIIANVLDE